MRWNLLLFAALFSSSILYAQPGVNYQAAVRDAQGAIIANTNVSITITLTDGDNGPVLYQETHAIMSNELGLINLIISEGTVDQGTYASITGVQDLNIGIEAQVGDGPDIVDVGFTKVGAVPFALYGEDADADPGNEMQSLSISGDTLAISGGDGVSLVSIKTPFTRTDSSYQLDFTVFDLPQASNRSLTIADKVDFNRKSMDFLQNQANGMARASYGIHGSHYANFDIDLGKGIWDLPENRVGTISSFLNTAMEENFEYDVYLLSSFNLAGNNLKNKNFWRNDSQTDFGKYSESGMLRSFSRNNSAGSKIVLANSEGIIQGSMGMDLEQESNFLDCNSMNGDFSGGFLAQNQGGILATGIGGRTNWWLGHSLGSTLFAGFDPNATDTRFQLLFARNNENGPFIGIYGHMGNLNAGFTSFTGTPDLPYFRLLNLMDEDVVQIYVDPSSGDGTIVADVKNFAIDHPLEDNKEIVYASIEGPEAAAYERGTAQLVNGESLVECSEHFQLVADPGSMTVTVSPLSAESLGLAIVEKTLRGFRVKELSNGNGNYSFDYIVMCKRKGYEDYQVVRTKKVTAKSPHNELIEKMPHGKVKSIRDLVKKK